MTNVFITCLSRDAQRAMCLHVCLRIVNVLAQSFFHKDSFVSQSWLALICRETLRP